ncbi:MAG: HAMP domain-containing protein [Nitrospirae bacterium]|nr:HAMP domain-containing protein [Nitrospirota bacterium]
MPAFLKRSLETKIILSIGAVLAVLLGLSSAIDSWFETDGTYQVALKEMNVLANTIQKALIKDMREGRSVDVQEILEMVGTEKGIIAVRIFDEKGRILKSTDRFEIGRQAPASDIESYRAGVRDFISDTDGQKVAHIIHPISNAPQCYGCHGKESDVNGVLALEYSLADVESYLFSQRVGVGGLLVVTVLLTSLSIYLLLGRMVNGPLRDMQAAMAAAEEGNLDVRIPVGSEDEIGSLQKSFNNMLARINELNRTTIEQQGDLVKKEQKLQLQQALAEQNRALEAAHKEVVEKNRYYMEMLSFISHELKSPLVVLIGYSDLLLRGDLGELTISQKEALTAMERNVETLQEMIANYLDLSRLERGELELDRRPVELIEEVVKPVMAEYSDLLERATMAMRIETGRQEIRVSADPALLRSTLGNLVSNAIKYGYAGTDIHVEVEAGPHEVRLSVMNDGPGIPYEQLDKVFDRFTRLDVESTRSQKGSGLGLYIVKQIVELHGGKVWAESKAGSWAKITLTLPIDNQVV